jgi:hypothetical protein
MSVKEAVYIMGILVQLITFNTEYLVLPLSLLLLTQVSKQFCMNCNKWGFANI